ncbi:Transcriptional regulatory protein LiaR [Streptomyces alboniger]
MTVRVVLADDQPLVRSGLRVLMADHTDLEVVGEAATGAEAVQVVRDADPDVVVMDIRMPGMDGIEATRLITAGPATTRVLVLTTFDEDDLVHARSGPAPAASWSRTSPPTPCWPACAPWPRARPSSHPAPPAP